MEVKFTAAEIAAIVRPTAARGVTTEVVRGIAALADAGPGDLSFLGNAKYKHEVAGSRASVVLIPADFGGEPGPNQVHLVVENPSAALALVCGRVEQQLWPKPAPGIHPTAVVSPEARIAATASVGPLCVVEAGARVGERCQLQAQVFVARRLSVTIAG